ncbi:MAG: phosphate acyltransferase PlsX [Candidatus Cloacimonetes bacterium]|nr:phosphate acyltransferase PlsX [Candidatus Cloacimonadota bacterium]
MIIGLDAYGSDNAPFPEVEGAIIALREGICEQIRLFGDEELLNKELSKYFFDRERLQVVHCRDRISMKDPPAMIARRKKDSSLVRLIQASKDGDVDVAVSAGNTGAVMAASLFIYGRIPNVLRPALATMFPTVKGVELFLDVGANADCTAEHLVQFAEMGSLYSHHFFKIEKPLVGLINIGEESSKGNELYKAVNKSLSEREDINFYGNVEGKDLLKGVVDVVISDGFTGNIVLKTVEGAASSMFHILKEQFNADWISKLGALLSYPAFAYLKKKVDHREYGGALLVGLNGLSVIAHGRSDAKSIKNAIKMAVQMVESNFIEHAQKYYER